MSLSGQSNTNSGSSPLPSITTHITLGHGTPVGSITYLNGVKTYLSTPASDSVEDAILIFSDGFGIDSEDNRRLADNFAANGYFAVMPDLFRGESLHPDIPDGFNYNAWERMNLPANVEPLIRSVISRLRSRGVKRIGGAGYSIGTKYLARFMSRGGLCAGFMGHPWWLEREDVLAINKPVSIAFGSSASTPRRMRYDTETMLEDNGVPFQITSFSGLPDGFAVRSQTGEDHEKFVKDEVFRQAIQWLHNYMKGSERGPPPRGG